MRVRFERPGLPAELPQIRSAGGNASVREIRENAIDTEPEEFEIFLRRIGVIVGREIGLSSCLNSLTDE